MSSQDEMGVLEKLGSNKFEMRFLVYYIADQHRKSTKTN